MKLTFFTLHFPVASETFVLNQIIYFIKSGYDVEIISVFPGDMVNKHSDFERYNLSKITHYLLPEEQMTNSHKLKQRLGLMLPSLFQPSLLKSLNIRRYGTQSSKLLLPAIIAANRRVFRANLFLAHFGYAGVLANKLRELGLLSGKQATIFHGADISRYHILKEHIHDYRNLFSQTELILPVSYLWKRKLIEMGCPMEKITITRMGIEPEKFNFKPRSTPHNPLRILSVARLSEKKGLDVAIRACGLLKALSASFRYTIVGTGDQEAFLRTLIINENLQDHVQLVGFKPQEEVKRYLDHADIFLLPSLTARDGDMEGIPVALMEAMATGLPVVSSDHSGIPELIQHDVSGWLADEGDTQSLAAILFSLASGERQLKHVIRAARTKIETAFNQHIVWRQLAAALEGVA